RKPERAADQRTMLVHQALAALVQIRTRRRRGALEERVFYGWRTVAKIGMIRRLDDLLRSANDHLPPRRMQFLQPFRDQRDVAGADLEQAIAAEGTAASALQVL